jgi:hypothetical protein
MSNYKLSFSYIIIVAIIASSCGGSTEINDKRIINNQVNLTGSEIVSLKDSFPVRMWSKDGNIIVSLAPQNIVVEYDLNGNKLATHKPINRTSTTSGTLWFYAQKEYNSYWVHDYSNSQINKFDLDSDVLIKSQNIVTKNNISYIGDDLFFVPTTDTIKNEFNISIYNHADNRVEGNIEISNLTKQPKPSYSGYNSYIYDGQFIRNDSDIHIYYCYNSGIFFKLDPKNRTAIMFHDYRNIPIPEAYDEFGSVKLKPFNVSFVSATCDEDYIYFLTTENKQVNRSSKFYIDTYSIKTGKYTSSIPISSLYSERPRIISKIKGKFIIVYEDGSIFLYKM